MTVWRAGGRDNKYAKEYITRSGKRYKWYAWAKTKAFIAGMTYTKRAEGWSVVIVKGECDADSGMGWNYYARKRR